MPSRSYYLQQAQVYQSLARTASNFAVKARCEQLTLEFLDKAADAEETEADDFLDFLTAVPKKPADGRAQRNEPLSLLSFAQGSPVFIRETGTNRLIRRFAGQHSEEPMLLTIWTAGLALLIAATVAAEAFQPCVRAGGFSAR